MRPPQRRDASRRGFLAASAAAALAAFAAACGEPAPPAVSLGARPYWEPALTVATDSLDVVRTLELNIRELAAGSQTPEQFAAAAQARFEAIGALGQALVPLNPPATAVPAHRHLTTAVDALVEIIPTLRAYEELEEPERLVHVITLQKRARSAVGAFAEAVGPGRAKDWLLATIAELGEFQFDVVRVPMLAVLVGPFDDESAARARIGQRLPTLRMSRVFRRWVEAGRYPSPDEADAAAREWQLDGLATRIEDVVDLAFTLTDVRAPSAGRWTERAWLARTDFDITALAASDQAELVLAIARNGAVAAFGPDGDSRWTRNLKIPLSRAAVSGNGQLMAAHGFDLLLLDAEGRSIWRSPARPDNQLLEDVVFAPGGDWLVVRSTNASDVGHVFAFGHSGQLWGPTRAYISAADVALNPDTGTVAVASSNNRGENHIVLITPAGNLGQRFGVDGEVHKVLFTQTGEHTVAVTDRSSQIFDSARGDLVWQIGYPSSAAARLPAADTIVLAGPNGLAAFSVTGTELWQVPGLAVERLLVTDAYVIAQTSERALAVFRADGTQLGQLVTSSEIRAAAAAPAANLLLTANAQRAIEAWQLPDVEPAAG
ncbi:MAG: PQQ-binding-like beta-propeller repeat protein [Chloroflexi bacterium]|nr:PQQ-binding-like beta-propeller repeat protein [Chloroflexota bacterium]